MAGGNTFKGPTYRYGPNGEAKIFNDSNDVPEGWLDHHPTPAEAAEIAVIVPGASAAIPMTREEIIAALEGGGIGYKRNAGTKALYDQLTVKVKEHLVEREIAFPAGADTKALLELLSSEE